MRRGVAHVPDGRGTFMELTVEENLRLGAYIRRDRQASQRTSNACSVISRACANGSASRPARCRAASSRCWRSRARCCCVRKLLLLDEPSFGLAPLIVQEIFEIMQRIRVGGGRQSSCWSSRTPAWRWIFADQAYLLETGRIVVAGPAAEIRRDEAVRRSYLGY